MALECCPSVYLGHLVINIIPKVSNNKPKKSDWFRVNAAFWLVRPQLSQSDEGSKKNLTFKYDLNAISTRHLSFLSAKVFNYEIPWCITMSSNSCCLHSDVTEQNKTKRNTDVVHYIRIKTRVQRTKRCRFTDTYCSASYCHLVNQSFISK